MTTNMNMRVNVTFDDDTLERLTTLAKAHRKSLSAITREFVVRGIQDEEDRGLSTLAKQRYEKEQKWISHDEFWATVLQD
jgi:predicted DNA-binding protein